MLVIDASLALEILLPTPLGARHGDRVLGEELHAPHLIDVEFANSLRRMILRTGLDKAIARRALDTMQNLALQRHEHFDLLPRIWELRDSASACDATYIAVAEALRAPLLTCDGKMSRSHGHRANIILIS
ncbi:MAG TPA: type II toxin-antitoxin system VapC family toxin [Rhizomicrobium sp.]|jgi:predicted nucleic acid-binding protein